MEFLPQMIDVVYPLYLLKVDEDGKEVWVRPEIAQRLLKRAIATIKRLNKIELDNSDGEPYAELEYPAIVKSWIPRLVEAITKKLAALQRNKSAHYEQASSALYEIEFKYKETPHSITAAHDANVAEIDELLALNLELRGGPPALAGPDNRPRDYSPSKEELTRAIMLIPVLKEFIRKAKHFSKSHTWQASLSIADAGKALDAALTDALAMLANTVVRLDKANQTKWRDVHAEKIAIFAKEFIRIRFEAARHRERPFHIGKPIELGWATSFVHDYYIDRNNFNVGLDTQLEKSQELLDEIKVKKKQKSLPKAQVSDRTRKRYQI